MMDFLGVQANARLRGIDMPARAESKGLLLGRLGIRSSGKHRIGRSGDWRSHFDKRDLAFFRQEAGDMMRRLGYRD